MVEIIKNILFYSTLIFGGISLICLLVVGMIRAFCLMMDHLRIGKVLKELVPLYIKQKETKNKIEPNDIQFPKKID